MSEFLIKNEQSVVPSLDVSPAAYSTMLKQLSDAEGVYAIKIGFRVGLGLGLRQAVDLARAYGEDKLVIYDHQKAATDIPDTAVEFAEVCANAGVDAAILYPRLNKPLVVESWVKRLQDEQVTVIVGAELTDDHVIKNNYQTDPYLPIFQQAIDLGVREFAVPANKIYRLNFYRKYFNKALGGDSYSFFGIGIGRQGGTIEEFSKNAPTNRHAVIGRAITKAASVRIAAEKYSSQIISAG